MKAAFFYATKVWLTAVLIAPYIFCISENGVQGLLKQDASEVIAVNVLSGAFFTIPTWFILGMVVRLVNGLAIKLISKKLLLTAISIAVTAFPYLFFTYFPTEFYWCECVAITLGIWFYKLPPYPLDQLS